MLVVMKPVAYARCVEIFVKEYSGTRYKLNVSKYYKHYI